MTWTYCSMFYHMSLEKGMNKTQNEKKKIKWKYTRPCRAYEKLTNVIEFWLHFVLLFLYNPFFCECVELVTYFQVAFRTWLHYCRWIQ